MKSSGNSSATAPPQPAPAQVRAATPPLTLEPFDDQARTSFSLTGRSVDLDPRTHAVRRDIADIRLAEYVFAPHYAVPMIRAVSRAALLRSGRDEASDTMVDLNPGDSFEVLEIAGVSAWGVARPSGLVGYVEAAALDLSPDVTA